METLVINPRGEAARRIVSPTIRETRGATVNAVLREVTVEVGRRLETTRLLDPRDPNFEATVARLGAERFEWTRLHQARALCERADFPTRSASFLVRGDVFYAPLDDGEPRNCHAVWNHMAKRFVLVRASGYLPWHFVAMTRADYP